MGLSQKLTIALTLFCTAVFAGDDAASGKMHALYLMHSGKVDAAIEKYQEIARKNGPDFEMLRQLAFSLMKQGAQKDAESRLLAIFGAGLAGNVSSLEILEDGLLSSDQQTQLAALLFIAKINDDYSDELLIHALNSDFLPTRMEACFHLAMRKHPHAVGYIEALMCRLPPFFKAFFAQLYALAGDREAIAILHKFMGDPSPMVRIETIHSLVQFGRDDFIPVIRKHLSHGHYGEKEACAYALGILRDTTAHAELKKLAANSGDNTKLAALKSLYLLGDSSVRPAIEEMALERNPFAIASLGGIPGAEDLLADLQYDPHVQVRINAGLALLQRRDKRCLRVLREIFIDDTRDLALQPMFSLGRAQQAVKIVPSAEARSKDPMFDPGVSLSMREHFLVQTVHLEEEEFLKVARMIFEAKQNDLVPLTIHLLENLQTEKATLLLKEQTQKMGAPFIRDYCNLALFRLKEEGPYEENLIKWVMRQKKEELIKLRPILPLKTRQEIGDYTLTTEETSRLLIDSYSALASRQDQKSIDIVLTALKEGNEKSRYALAGLLMKATE